MSQLLMTEQPGFFDIGDSTLAAGQPLTDDSILKISHNAKFGVVRSELIYMGFYAHGNTVPAPVSPVDGYQYSYPEIMFTWLSASTRAAAAGFTPGQATLPGIANTNAGAGQLYHMVRDVNDANGMVTCITSYYVTNGAETPTNDGFVKVYALCQRSSVNLPVGIAGD